MSIPTKEERDRVEQLVQQGMSRAQAWHEVDPEMRPTRAELDTMRRRFGSSVPSWMTSARDELPTSGASSYVTSSNAPPAHDTAPPVTTVPMAMTKAEHARAEADERRQDVRNRVAMRQRHEFDRIMAANPTGDVLAAMRRATANASVIEHESYNSNA